KPAGRPQCGIEPDLPPTSRSIRTPKHPHLPPRVLIGAAFSLAALSLAPGTGPLRATLSAAGKEVSQDDSMYTSIGVRRRGPRARGAGDVFSRRRPSPCGARGAVREGPGSEDQTPARCANREVQSRQGQRPGALRTLLERLRQRRSPASETLR